MKLGAEVGARITPWLLPAGGRGGEMVQGEAAVSLMAEVAREVHTPHPITVVSAHHPVALASGGGRS